MEAPLVPPFAAVKVVPALFHTQEVSSSTRMPRCCVQTERRSAASTGGAAEGISGHGAAGYLAGNGLLPALGLAFLAAEHVASVYERLATPTTS